MDKLGQLATNLVVVVKDGANGAYYQADGTVHHMPAVKVEPVVNATGAGDSFNAGVIAALLKGQHLDEAVANGCRVAAAKLKAQDMPAL